MKAINIMLFLFILNVVISIVGGLHIYNMDITGSYEYDEIQSDLGTSTTDVSFYTYFAGTAVFILVGSTLLGATFSWLSGGKVVTAAGAVYGFFGGLMTTTFINSYRILWNIVENVPQQLQGGVSIVVGLFIAVTAFMFLIGFVQLIVGGIEQFS